MTIDMAFRDGADTLTARSFPLIDSAILAAYTNTSNDDDDESEDKIGVAVKDLVRPNDGFHVNYYSEGNITLQSADGVKFRVYATVVRRCSMLVAAWLEQQEHTPSSATPNPESVLESDILQIAAPVHIVQQLLDVIYPSLKPIPVIKTIEHASQLIDALRLFQSPKLESILRPHIFSNRLILSDPIRAFGLAYMMGWKEQYRMASTVTLRMSLTSEEALTAIEGLDQAALVELQKLHQSRIQGMKDKLDHLSRHPFVHKRCQSLNPSIYGRKELKRPIKKPYIFPTSHMWEPFCLQVVESMNARPLGDQLLQEEFWDCGAFEEMRDPMCTGCVVTISIKGRLLSVVKETLSSLPIHV